MKAIVVGESGPAISDVPVPQPGPDQALVRVHAAALNRADLGMAAGHRHGASGGAGAVLGLEWAGEVVEAGPTVPGFKPGDRVMCSGAGGFAEYAVTDWGRVLPVPSGMSLDNAATLPVALQTMHDAIVTNGRMATGEAVLILGASSGVGLMAMQIAKHLGGRLIIGTSTNPERRARLADFGADLALDSSEPSWVDEVLDATGGRGVDLVIDQVSGDATSQAMRATRILGRIVNVGRLGGMRAEFDFDLHALRRIHYIGVTFRTRTPEEVREITRRLREDLWDAVESGAFHLPIDRAFPLDEAPAALDYMRANRHFGKLVLTV
jgi:NADPH:quinone reductase